MLKFVGSKGVEENGALGLVPMRRHASISCRSAVFRSTVSSSARDRGGAITGQRYMYLEIFATALCPLPYVELRSSIQS